MIEAFWDSSVLTALCVQQPLSRQAERWAAQYGMAVWWATRVEVSSAIARLRRSGALTVAARLGAARNLRLLGESWHEISASDVVRDEAQRLLPLYPLRAADSLQLAAALVWCRNRPVGRNFICADERLSEAAEQAGFTALRP